MKKAFVLAMAAALTAAAWTPAMAKEKTTEVETEAVSEEASEAEQNTLVLSYEDIDPEVYDGVWVSTGYGFDLYLPSDWNVLDASEIDGAEDAGIVYMAQAEEALEDGTKATVTVSAKKVDGIENLQQIYEELDETGEYSSLTYCDANGIPAVGFDSKEQNVSGLAFADTDGYMYVVAVTPNDNKDFAAAERNIILSVSPTLTEESSSEAETAEE